MLMTPLLCYSLALKLSLDLLPRLRLNVRKNVRLGASKLCIRASLEPQPSGLGLTLSKLSFTVNWRPWDSVEARVVAGKPSLEKGVVASGGGGGNALRVKYLRQFKVDKDCQGQIAGHMDIPTSLPPFSSLEPDQARWGVPPVRLAIDSLRITRHSKPRAKRDPPQTVRRYLRASTHIGRLETIAVVPGHWIDPGFEPGAPGEREFNLEVANALERKLRGTGWDVLRPDRDAPDLQWEGYLNWVSRQTMRGIPVIEIHGQGSAADYRGFVLGVIGDKEAPLSKELASKFGLFAMDWKELAVPRRGGVILESFNSDEVLQMAPWHRTWAVSRLATRIADCVEGASARNRQWAAHNRQQSAHNRQLTASSTQQAAPSGEQASQGITPLIPPSPSSPTPTPPSPPPPSPSRLTGSHMLSPAAHARPPRPKLTPFEEPPGLSGEYPAPGVPVRGRPPSHQQLTATTPVTATKPVTMTGPSSALQPVTGGSGAHGAVKGSQGTGELTPARLGDSSWLWGALVPWRRNAPGVGQEKGAVPAQWPWHQRR